MVVPELAAETTKCNAYTILSISGEGRGGEGEMHCERRLEVEATAPLLNWDEKLKSSCLGSTVPIAVTITMGLSEAPSPARLPP